MNKHDNKSTIDKLRDSALSMQVGVPSDGSICHAIPIGDHLHLVSEHAIFEIQLADEIDPARTNPAIPNTNQKVLSYGAKDPAVGRILLTAHALFKSSHLGPNFPEKHAVKLAFDALRDVTTMLDLSLELEAAIKEVKDVLQAQVAKDQSYALPAIGDTKNRCDAFTQKLGHAIDTIKQIALLFYPDDLSKKWIDSLRRLASERYGDDAPLACFMHEAHDDLLQMREIRNKIEHPKDNSRVLVSDFRLTTEMTLEAPQVEIVKPNEPSTVIDMLTFMSETIEQLTYYVEMFIALLCGANAMPFGNSRILLVELPERRRTERNPHQRISWGIEMNGEIHPMS